jgi:predicted metalloendopeptidase
MDRIIGQQQRILKQAGILGPESIPDEQMYEYFKELRSIDMDIVVDFQEVSPTARAAMATQMMQFKAAGAPIPLEMIVEASDMPYSREIIAKIQQQGEQLPDPNLAKAVAAGQGQAGPSGVNATA